MANAESYKGGNPPFFPLQGPRARRDADVRTPPDSGNVGLGLVKPLTDAEENAVWSQYEATPPTSGSMERASNLHQRRWLIPAILAASVAIGLAYAALSDKPETIREPTLASQGAIQNPRNESLNAAQPLGGAEDAAAKPQIFDSPQPNTPPSTANPDTSPNKSANAVERSAKRATPAKSPPPIVSEEPPPPAPTYNRGPAPATTPSTPVPAPNPVPDAGPLMSPTPTPGALDQAPPLKLEPASPAETVPAPESVPENAQSPQ